MAIPEILAPVGGQEQLLAAVRCGADSVYLGLRGLNARRNATNFEDAELMDVVRYCHVRGVKVYLTVNTLVLDEEMLSLEQTADTAAEAGVDGVILQDMAALRLFQRRWPGIHRVASTQTAVHDLDGALFLQDAGFDSFVLARELSLREMDKICSRTEIPAEAFVHGAHCMSLSGTCYLSAMLGGRSGDRGLCAQPCRLDWRCGERDHALSLKDMSLLSHIPALQEAGVQTLKIEGRMKRPEYVAAAVTACRAARAGEPYDAQSLRAVFSRSGHTDGYLMGRTDAAMFGHRTKDDVTGAEQVLKQLAGLYHKEVPLVPVRMSFTMSAEGAQLTVSDGTEQVTVQGDAPQTAVSRPTDAAAAERNLTKTGGTPYYTESFLASIAPGLMLPASSLNDMRRRALGQLDDLRGAPRVIQRGDYVPVPVQAHAHHAPSPLWARFYTAQQVTMAEHLDKIILPVEEISLSVLSQWGDKLIAQLPALLFPEEEPALEEALSAWQACGLGEVWTDNIYGIRLGKRLGLTVHGGFGLNITNSQALDFYRAQGLASLTVSVEISMKQIRALGGEIPRGIIAYGHLPLMRFRNCPVRAGIGCGTCRKEGYLTDRRGIRFSVECGGTWSTLLNSVPIHIAGRDDPGDFRVVYLTREDREGCGTVISDFLLDRRTQEPHTGGLYYRDLL